VKDFNIALSLLREGNSDMMREIYPDLQFVFNHIDEQRKEIEALHVELEDARWG
jgi:hypothetical protein